MVHTVKFFNNAFSAVIVNKNEGSQEMFVLKNSSFISNIGIISSEIRLIKFAEIEQNPATVLVVCICISQWGM